MDFEGIILSEISQSEKDSIARYHCYVESKKYNKLVNMLKKKKWQIQIVFVQSFSHIQLFVIPSTAVYQASLSFTNFWSLLKLMSVESVKPSNSFILCYPFLLSPSIFPSS